MVSWAEVAVNIVNGVPAGTTVLIWLTNGRVPAAKTEPPAASGKAGINARRSRDRPSARPQVLEYRRFREIRCAKGTWDPRQPEPNRLPRTWDPGRCLEK